MRIVQISDFHLKPGGAPAYDVADTALFLEKTVAHINTISPAPDVVIVTGDIADGGASESYALCRELLSPLTLPVFIVPGNHDQKDNLAAEFPHHRYLKNRIDGGNVCYTVEDFPVRLVGMDTVTPGSHGGGVDTVRLAWLDKTLSQRPDEPTLVFMHHPPFISGIGHMDAEPFRMRHELEEVIRSHPQVERLACGHIHRSISRRFGGTTAVVCPGVGMQLALDLRPDAPSGFVLEPPALLVHFLEEQNPWGDPPHLLTHENTVEDPPGVHGGFHPFFKVISPL